MALVQDHDALGHDALGHDALGHDACLTRGESYLLLVLIVYL